MVDDRLLEGVDILSRSHIRCQCWCRANWSQVRLASLESDILLPYIEWCSDRWSGHVPPKLKSEINEDNSNYFLGDNERVYLVCAFWGVYIELMEPSLSCNDDCVDCQLRYCSINWAIISSKGGWLVPSANCRTKILNRVADYPFSLLMFGIVCNN